MFVLHHEEMPREHVKNTIFIEMDLQSFEFPPFCVCWMVQMFSFYVARLHSFYIIIK